MEDRHDEVPWQALAQGPAAAAAADLDSMISDFEFVEACCRRLAALDPAGPDHTLHRALWEAAVISYGRSFKSGNGHVPVKRQGRTRIPAEVLSELSESELAMHRAALDERDGHIGHRVNGSEGANVRVVLAPPPRQQVLNVITFRVRNIAGAPRAAMLGELAARLGELLQPHRRAAQEAIARDAHGDLDGIYEVASPMPTD